ncbi:hypothetical protein PMAYCL1PPCAC_26025, partial [Pristionchus mayeri]
LTRSRSAWTLAAIAFVGRRRGFTWTLTSPLHQSKKPSKSRPTPSCYPFWQPCVKIDNLIVNVVFPDWTLDDDKLTEYYRV